AFRRTATRRGFCALGSVKSNIGHLDTAAGIAGLIKTVLALRHGEIPPLLHYRKANPEIDLDASPFYITERLRAWPNESPRIAGVSSFGVGGTNCHVIVEEAPAARAETQATAMPGYLVTLSAASAAALTALEASYTRFLAQSDDANIAAIAATTQRSRSLYSYRTAIVGETAAEICARLSKESKRPEGGWRGKAVRGYVPAIAFLFAGQGSQYTGMGRALYDTNPEFHRTLQRCEEILRAELKRPLLEVMFAGPDELLQRTEYAQPALFALEYALAELLRSWGIGPCLLLGHSLGEYVAACVAGVFSLEDGIVLAARRGRLMQQLPSNGKMLAVTAEESTLGALIEQFLDEVSVAAINTPIQTVLSGDARAIEQVKGTLQQQGIYCWELAVSHAFHSAHMNPALAPIESLVSDIELRPPRLPLISNLYGRAVTTEVTDPAYWRDQTRRPVQFAAGIRTMIEAGCELFVEIGPDKVLTHLTQDFDARRPVETVSTLRRGEHDWNALLESVARLYVRGAEIDWNSLQNGRRVRPVRLPDYPFQHTRYWYEGPLLKNSGSAGHPLLGRRLRLPGSAEIRFETRFSQTAPHFLSDHRLFGVSLPPGASHFAMLAQASKHLAGARGGHFRFENLFMLRPLLLPHGCERHVQLIFRPEAESWSVELTSSLANEDGGDWTPHVIGWARAHRVGEQNPDSAPLDLEAIKLRCREEVSSKDFYSRIWANQVGTGSSFRWVDSIWRGAAEALGRAVCPESVTDAALYRLHPGLIEAACQVLHCCETIETAQGLERTGATFVPFSVDAFIVFDTTVSHDRAWCHALLREHSENDVLADLSIFNDAGEVAARLEGFHLRPITRDRVTGSPTTAREADQSPPTSPASTLEFDKPAASLEEISRYLQRRCAELSGFPDSQMTADKSFIALGLDSLVAMMLANQIRRDFAVAIAVTEILLSTSLDSLAQDIWQALSR
ncbi:MAG TPA: acyltransferase domain-containing protein, partial [Candidatus Limnocylindria bacterium]|nr:acyltransferase domain-containing protein [Candidatus Limnocylindria bacterium]